MDTKILTRLLTARMEETLSKIIGPEQLAFVKGRNIVEGIRTIDYVIEACTKDKQKLCVCAFDFTKAFVSISHEYLWKLLKHVGYGEKNS